MPKEKFEIGEKEKHYFTIEVGMPLARVKIEQDGVIVANKVLNPFVSKKFKFDVGTSESHHVEISVGPVYLFPIELKVDGEKVRPLL